MSRDEPVEHGRDELIALARAGGVGALPRGLRERVIGAVIDGLGGEEAARLVTGFPPPCDVQELQGPLAEAVRRGELALDHPGLGLVLYLLGAPSEVHELGVPDAPGLDPPARPLADRAGWSWLVGDEIERAWRRCGARRSIELVVSRLWTGEPVDPAASIALSFEARGLVLDVRAVYHDDPPPPGAPGSCWGLWEHEVVELFLVGADGRYTEIELGPHGHHLVLQFAGRRNLIARDLPLTVEALAVDRAQATWRATVRLDPALVPPRPLWYNAYAIHGQGPARRYLAHAAVPGPAPDFHRLDDFRLLAV